MKSLLEQIVKALVDHPEKVSIWEVSGSVATVYEVSCAPEDLGQVIGKEGRLANAMRAILSAAGAKAKRCVKVEILETQQ